MSSQDCMKRHTGLDWVSLTHLTSAAAALEEAQRVAMYAQVRGASGPVF